MSQLLKRIFDVNHMLTQRRRDLSPQYRVTGTVRRGGVYNSHLVFGLLLGAAAAAAIVPWTLAAWLLACLLAAVLIDPAPWRRKLRWSSLPGQVWLYSQVAVQAAADLLPMYLLAFALYVGVKPLWGRANLGFNTFYVLYGIYLAVRSGWLLWCLGIVAFRWDAPVRPRPLHGDEANLRSRGTAAGHLLWAYFLGNVGVSVRCAAYLLTVALLERLRIGLRLDLTQHESLAPHLLLIAAACSAVWLLTLGAAVRRATLVYYRVHRTLHACKPLYDSVHAVHHKGVLPSPLDSGTISPAEFAITEYALPAMTLTPDWYWTMAQVVIAAVGHWPAHFFGAQSEVAQHHVDHHRRFTANFGLLPGDDELFGTRCPPGFAAPPSRLMRPGRS